VSLFASGSEVEIAVAAQKDPRWTWQSRRAWSRCPRWNCCFSQPEDKQKAIIGNAPVKVAIEAAVPLGLGMP